MKILLIRRGAIGDVLMTTPLIRQIRLNNPKSQIDYCIANSSAIALKNNLYIDNLIKLDDKVFSAKGVFKFIKFMFGIRNKYDYIFILGKNWLINLLCRASGAKLIGFAREKISEILLHKFVTYSNVLRYQGLYYLDLLKESGLGRVNYWDLTMDLSISSEDINFVDDKLKALNIFKQQYVVVTNSGGNNQFETGGIRMLPEDLILSLLKKLGETNTVILLGGTIDWVNYDRYIAALNNHNILSFAGELSLSQSCYLLSGASHFYVTDCGAMHLGIISGISEKMTCFFGPTNPAHIIPSYSKCKIIWTDQNIFDDQYQIYGKVRDKHVKYFRKLMINEIV